MPQTITKKALVERITQKTGVKRADVRSTIQEFLDQVILELKRGNRLEFRDFGVFEVKERAARQAQNPKTLERVEVPPKRTVKFKVGRLMRESVELFPPQQAHPPAGVAAPTTPIRVEPKPVVRVTTNHRPQPTPAR